MKCLIIASGQGLRLKAKGDSKPLVPLLGLPLLERVILTAKKSGLTDFYVVSGYNGEKLKRHLEHFSRARKVNITSITNVEWEKKNGISVLKAKERFKENFILLMSDHIFDESILTRLKNKEIAEDEVILAVDYNIKTNKFVDADDVTKVLVEENRILDIGKHIQKFNAYDTGIFLCSTAIFSAIQESLQNGDGSLSGGIRLMAKMGKAKTFDINGSYWLDVDDKKMLKKVESKLLTTLKKPSDGPVSRYLNRPISTRITKQLLKTNITPNYISLFSFIISILGAFFFFLGDYINLVIGATLAQISSIIDGCDGEIARLKFLETEFGAWFDAVLDRYADAFLLLGLTSYVYFINKSSLILLIGFLAIIGTFMNSYTADKYDGLMKKKIGKRGHYFRMGRDVRMFIIFLGALINQPLLILILIAFLMNAENVRRILILYRNG